jgi:hypothetical protein
MYPFWEWYFIHCFIQGIEEMTLWDYLFFDMTMLYTFVLLGFIKLEELTKYYHA